jgi:hypothetical protein
MSADGIGAVLVHPAAGEEGVGSGWMRACDMKKKRRESWSIGGGGLLLGRLWDMSASEISLLDLHSCLSLIPPVVYRRRSHSLIYAFSCLCCIERRVVARQSFVALCCSPQAQGIGILC